MEDQALYQLALTRTPGIGPVHTRKLIEHFGDAKAIFRADRATLTRAGLDEKQIRAFLHFPDQEIYRRELALLTQKGIRPLFFTDPDYPRRLQQIGNAPPLLFYQGAADLNAGKVIAIVGTRGPTDYGRQMTEQLIRDLAQPDLLIVSGLAFGIDAAAHKAALVNKIPTIGVLGHGLARCYPPEHTGLAKAMRQQGGLLSPFPVDSGPEPYRFPMRNHLVAGLCDALIVVESGDEGGSLLTAENARACGKRVFAVPGRVTDPKSAGCLRLIRQHGAGLLVSGEQLQTAMNWNWPAGRTGFQPNLPFPASGPGHPPEPTHPSGLAAPSQPTGRSGSAHPFQPAGPTNPAQPSGPQPAGPESRLVELLNANESLSIDELAASSHLDTSSVAVTLLHLELQGLVRPLPGRRYRLSR